MVERSRFELDCKSVHGCERDAEQRSQEIRGPRAPRIASVLDELGSPSNIEVRIHRFARGWVTASRQGTPESHRKTGNIRHETPSIFREQGFRSAWGSRRNGGTFADPASSSRERRERKKTARKQRTEGPRRRGRARRRAKKEEGQSKRREDARRRPKKKRKSRHGAERRGGADKKKAGNG